MKKLTNFIITLLIMFFMLAFFSCSKENTSSKESETTSHTSEVTTTSSIITSTEEKEIQDKLWYQFEDKSFVYDGQIKSLEVLSETKDFSVEYLNNSQKEPGTYNVKATISKEGYYDLELNATLTILKKDLEDEIFFDSEIIEYTGEPYKPEEFEGLSYTFLNSEGQFVSQIKNVGVYTVYYSFDGNNYYNSCQGNYTIEITKATLLRGDSEIITKDELSQFNILNIDVLVDSYEIAYFKDGISLESITDSGLYTVLVNIPETDNYTGLIYAYNLLVLDSYYTKPVITDVYYKIESTGAYLYFKIKNISSSSYITTGLSISLDGDSIPSSKMAFQPFQEFTFCISLLRPTEKNYDNYYSINPTGKTLKYDGYEFNLTNDFYSEINFGSSISYSTKPLTTAKTLYESSIPTKSLSLLGYSESMSYEDTKSLNIDTPYFIDASIDSSLVCLENVDNNEPIYVKNGTISFYITTYVTDTVCPYIESNENAHILSLDELVDFTSWFNIYDDYDGEIELESSMIDTSKVDVSNEGVYPLYITVCDSHDNLLNYTYNVHVVKGLSNLSSYFENETIETDKLNNTNVLPSTGNVKGIVIPVSFDTTNETEELLENIDSVFNGSAYKSVASFFKNSSYNKLNLSFDVYNGYIRASYNVAHYAANYTEIISEILIKAESLIDFTKYDSNSDGYVDGIWFIYNIPYTSSGSICWAWELTQELNMTIDSMHVKTCSFISSSFLNSSDTYNKNCPEYKGSNPLTGRVVVHETCHMFGLYDEYNNYGLTTFGGLTMLEHNLSDINTADKLLLGWIDPIVVDTSTTIDLYSFEDYSENNSIIIKRKINVDNNIFDDFIMVEYFTQSGENLNESSSFSENGIRIIYLSALLEDGKFKYANDLSEDSKMLVKAIHVNDNDNVTLADLFLTEEGEVFGGMYQRVLLNDMTYASFKIEIESKDSSKIGLKITL